MARDLSSAREIRAGGKVFKIMKVEQVKVDRKHPSNSAVPFDETSMTLKLVLDEARYVQLRSAGYEPMALLFGDEEAATPEARVAHILMGEEMPKGHNLLPARIDAMALADGVFDVTVEGIVRNFSLG